MLPVPAVLNESLLAGWEITENWKTEDRFGNRGFVTFEFYSGEGKGLKDRRPNQTLRCALSLLTNVDPPIGLLYQCFPQARGMNQQQIDAMMMAYIKSTLAQSSITFTYA
jgi:hypothetical protein